VIKSRPITDHEKLDILVWIHIKMNQRGSEIVLTSI